MALVVALLAGLGLVGGLVGRAVEAAPPDGGDRPRLTRFVYLAPADRPVRDLYVGAIDTAARRLQSWFAGELGGATFRTTSSPVELCQSRQPASHFLADPWLKVTAELSTCVSWRFHDPNFRWIVYADVPSECGGEQRLGRGVDGVTIMGEQALQGLAGAAETSDPCGYLSDEPATRWIGGLGHELGHALGLSHPAGCDDGLPACDVGSLMWTGYGDWPATSLGPDERAALAGNPFLGAPGPWVPDVPTSLVALDGSRGGPDLRADQILVTWLAPLDDGGRPISAFRVTATPPLPGGPALATAADRSIVLGGATGGITYTVRVEALNAVGVGAPSAPSNPVILPIVIGDASGISIPHGYWVVSEDGSVYAFGGVESFGPPVPVATGHRAVDIAPTMSGHGYWVVDDRGEVSGPGRRHPARLARPRAPGAGRAGGLDLGDAERARVLALHQPRERPPLRRRQRPRRPVEGDARRGDHRHHRHAVGPRLLHGRRQRRDLHVRRRRLPRVPGQRAAQRAHGGDRAVDDGAGLLAGRARRRRLRLRRRAYRGSVPAVLPRDQRLNAPVAGMVRYGDGYLLVGRDGGVFNFSSGGFFGSLGSAPPRSPISALAAS